MSLTRFGLQIHAFPADASSASLFERVVAVARTAEASGFDSLWVMDHLQQIPFVGGADDPMLEAYTLLGAIAARTRTARLGTLVSGVTHRNPALLAKAVTTLDVVSGGRAVLGIGAAWFAEEHARYGFRFPGVTERMERLEDALRICTAMFAGGHAAVAGGHASVDGAPAFPRPVQERIPVLVGGGGERRTLRLAARYADAANFFGDVPTLRRKLDVLARHCSEIGRDPAGITTTRIATLLMRERPSDAQAAAEAFRRARGLDADGLRHYAVAGSPEQVCEQVAACFETGLDGIVFNMPDAYHLEHLETAGRTLRRAFG